MHRIPIKYHVFFWIGLVSLSIAALSPYYVNLFKASLHRIVFIPVWLFLTYINLFYLLPKFWDEGKKLLNVILILILVFVLTILQRIVCIEWIYPKYFWMRAPNADELNPFWIGPFVQFASFIALPVILSIGLREAWKWYQESYKAKQIIAEQKEAELSYLKAQVNPHFLFNTLNNLYGLSLESSKEVPAMILKLSDLLSYSLYEAQAETVTIEKELKLINDLIGLEEARYKDRVEVIIKKGDALDVHQRIAPLLMLPLVENAFKHGVKTMEHLKPIVIGLNQYGKIFRFKVENHFEESNKHSAAIEINKSIGGLGLDNLKRRLNLHYPDRYQLEINQKENKFIVTLEIQIDE